MKRILVIEDDAALRANLVDMLAAEGYDVIQAAGGRAGIDAAVAEHPDLVICDVTMPEVDGHRVLAEIRANWVTASIPFVFLSARIDRSDVRAGMNLGADDYLTKPFTRAEVLEMVGVRLRRRESTPTAGAGAPQPKSALFEMVQAGAEARVVVGGATSGRWGAPSVSSTESRAERSGHAETDSRAASNDPAMELVYEQATRAAKSPFSVLLLGETGVGKEILAQEIHRRSPRFGKPFLPVNCAALSETLLDGELFGHEKGAFTGATQMRAGLFEAADGGTVFLDEVGELPPATQAKLLRVLEEKKVLRVGGRVPKSVDVRFIAATHRDLDAVVRQGTFRQDLLFRLNGITLHVPPLRERPRDVLRLARLFLEHAARQLGRADDVAFDAEVAYALERYHWPGNVRELRNAMERAVVLGDGNVLRMEHLPPSLAGHRDSSGEIGVSAGERAPSDPFGMRERVRSGTETLERQQILQALERCAGNQTQAAELLGISRRTLVSRLGAYGLPRPRKR